MSKCAKTGLAQKVWATGSEMKWTTTRSLLGLRKKLVNGNFVNMTLTTLDPPKRLNTRDMTMNFSADSIQVMYILFYKNKT